MFRPVYYPPHRFCFAGHCDVEFLTPESGLGYEHLRRFATDVQVAVCLEKGDMLWIDNHHSVHGRSKYDAPPRTGAACCRRLGPRNLVGPGGKKKENGSCLRA